ncbi:hypothetical protein QKT26_gp99 [Carcinus maenas nudivirus]|uniref:Uncharacterized protein n=1 Tax=Carcinus maenas nudivirus TaxID=2880837 RepID=A0AAE8Y2F4_9VIRU|nr:hypothetical protein QKT26_gp99 [Carcinus maenas nudivirus]UBZ25689.1 hypothetical protein CmNV_098 [Carcinus maenas nudivirus]
MSFFSESIFNTTLYNKWICYTLDIICIDPPISKSLLYKMCLSGHILAFTYEIARNKEQNLLKVVFKVLPAPHIVDMSKVWTSYYLKPKEIPSIPALMTVYVPRKLVIKFNGQTSICDQCETQSYGLEKCKQFVCLNSKCNQKTFDFYKCITQGPVILTLDDLSHKVDDIQCKKCKSCKICMKLKNGTKCIRHKICKHNQSNCDYHLLNKIANNKI